MADHPFDLADRRHLLFDDHLIADSEGFTVTLNPPARQPEPVLVCDRPWEVGGLLGDSNMSVVDDDGTIRLWYVVEYLEPGRDRPIPPKVEGLRLDPKTLADLRGVGRQYVLCHATSTDGVHFDKPDAGIVNYQGSRRNNMVFIDRLGCTVFKDPSAPAEERYKLIYGGGPKLLHVHLVEDFPPQEIYHAVYGATSPDGLHWAPYPQPIVPWYTDCTNVAYWDDEKRRYVAFLRSNEGMIYQDGQTVTPDPGFRLRYRAIGRTESPDFSSFPPPERIMEPTLDERRNYKKGSDYYNSAALKYPFAPGSYFLFSSSFHHQPDVLDVHLCTGRDGVHYHRWRQPYLAPGTEGRFDDRSIYMATGCVRRGDELLMYYLGCPWRHGEHGRRPAWSGGVGLVRQRLDGFVSHDARWSGGRLTTHPLTFTGNTLRVNFDGFGGGWLKVALLDELGRELPGHGLRDADQLWGNDTSRPVTWRGQADLSALSGRPVRLRFSGRGAKLFAFQFGATD